MKFVALVSGGKDSLYAILEAVRQGHELVACAHLAPRHHPVKCNPPGDDDDDDDDGDNAEAEEEESYMYQTAASECIPTLVEQCLGVPLIVRECTGRSADTSLVYDHGGVDEGKQRAKTACNGNHDVKNVETTEKVDDEVEDLLVLLRTVLSRHPQITAVTSGAILSTYQRTRIESVCDRLSLTSLSYLWRIGPQRSLLECMLEDEIEAVLVKVASPPGLMPRKHLNNTLNELYYSGLFDRLKARFDFHVCGEGGEYETLVVDAPVFKKRLVLDEVSIVETDDGVGILRIDKCHAEDKEEGGVEGGSLEESWKGRAPLDVRVREKDAGRDAGTACGEDGDGAASARQVAATAASQIAQAFPPPSAPVKVRHLPHVKALPGGLVYISEILSQTVFTALTASTSSADDDGSNKEAEADLAVQEALDVLSTLRQTLIRLPFVDGSPATPQDVVYVHLYLSDIAHFAKINSHYRSFFGTVLPPSRSCVSVGRAVLPGGRRVMLDCLLQRGSGRYMRPPTNDEDEFVQVARANPHHQLRSTLHVQSVSHWAPVCVGPYSQANTVRGGLTFLAGQIGLDPPTMTLRKGGWTEQLRQSWTNAASVLDALGGSSLGDCLAGLVYLGTDVVLGQNDGGEVVDADAVWDEAKRLCRRALAENGGIVAGYVDEIVWGGVDGVEKFGGYEDEGTWRELEGKENVSAASASSEHGLPLLMVALPQMPVGAVAEVELICASSRASSCLGCSFSANKSVVSSAEGGNRGFEEHIDGQLSWDTGHGGGFDCALKKAPDEDARITVDSSIGYVGKGCAAIACTTASCAPSAKFEDDTFPMYTEQVLGDMVESALQCIEEQAGLDMAYVLHVRLYYNLPKDNSDDGIHLRCALNSVLNLKWTSSTMKEKGWGVQQRHRTVPAATVVPVSDMRISSGKPPIDGGHNVGSTLLFAMQVMAVDSVHLETEMWINHGRSHY